MNVYDPDGHEVGGWSRLTEHEADLRAWLAEVDVSLGTDPSAWLVDGRPLNDAELGRARAATFEDWQASLALVEAGQHLRRATLPFTDEPS